MPATRLEAASSPRRAQAVARAAPDVIISNVRVPGSSGIDVLAAIRRANLEVPVILILLTVLRYYLEYYLEHRRAELHPVTPEPPDRGERVSPRR